MLPRYILAECIDSSKGWLIYSTGVGVFTNTLRGKAFVHPLSFSPVPLSLIMTEKLQVGQAARTAEALALHGNLDSRHRLCLLQKGRTTCCVHELYLCETGVLDDLPVFSGK